MDELVAKRILFDFEVIALITLLIGVIVFGVLGSFRRDPGRGIGSHFSAADLILVFFPLIFFLINPIISYYAGESPVPVEKSSFQQLMGGITQLLFSAFLCVITIIIMQHITERDAVEILGLRNRRKWIIIAYGLAGAVISLAFCSLFVGNFVDEFIRNTFGELKAQKPVEDMRAAKSIPVVAMSILLACVAAPVLEEILFRGYFYGVLKRFTSPMFGALVSSALFAVVHSNLPALVPLWLFAIILTLSYEMSRTLWVPILIHSLFNGFNIALLLISNGE